MKKIYLFAAAAALLTACSSEELSNSEVAQQNNAETPVAFSVYTPRSTTRAGVPKTITTASLQTGDHSAQGFGVFGYFTDGGTYDATLNPNFMYNQQVKWDGSAWKYDPVKYWPNEYGTPAISDEIDRVSFFAYAPWLSVNPTTGIPTTGVSEDEKNITAVTKNSAIGDPIIKYVVDTDPQTSVDLLWGVAAADYTTTWGPATSTVTAGKPFIDLMKPNDPLAATTSGDNKVRFNLRHALSKLFVSIDYFDDGTTYNKVGNLEASLQTKIFIREIKIGGFMMKGALNLNNTTANKPLWMAYDGTSELDYEETTFKDGRKDGKEGTVDGANDGEKYLGLNPDLIQSTPYETEVTGDKTVFTAAWNTANKGVTKTQSSLFATWDNTNSKWVANDITDNYIYVIPMEKPIDIYIVYDVETVNPKLAGKLSDNLTPGLSIENKIFKTSKQIFGTTDEVKMEAGKVYVLKLHLGMTSVKVDASVTDWNTIDEKNAELPANQ